MQGIFRGAGEDWGLVYIWEWGVREREEGVKHPLEILWAPGVMTSPSECEMSDVLSQGTDLRVFFFFFSGGGGVASKFSFVNWLKSSQPSISHCIWGSFK